ncbi:hypothetical protein [Pantoea agglomerans]|uniref:hypothetical protein n=1 Tax=Enterobacter agglomerans TaxID=549 RepID=UPI001653F882|nr:hypothetical protein [Pantoea agglomerans]
MDCNDAETLGLLLIMSSSMTLSGVGQQTSMRPGGHRRSEGIKLSGWFRRRDEAAAMHAKRKKYDMFECRVFERSAREVQRSMARKRRLRRNPSGANSGASHPR